MKAALKKESEIKKEEIHEIKHEKDDIEDTDEHQSGSENESGDSTDDENDELQIINGKTVEKKSKKKKSKLTPEELKKKLELEEVSYVKKFVCKLRHAGRQTGVYTCRTITVMFYNIFLSFLQEIFHCYFLGSYCFTPFISKYFFTYISLISFHKV